MSQQHVDSETEVVVHGRHVDLSTRFRDHVVEKLARVGKFGVPIARVDVEVSKETNPRLADRAYEVELTCRSRGPVIRAEAYATDHYSAFDLAFNRLTERLRRYAERNRPHRGGRHRAPRLAEQRTLADGRGRHRRRQGWRGRGRCRSGGGRRLRHRRRGVRRRAGRGAREDPRRGADDGRGCRDPDGAGGPRLLPFQDSDSGLHSVVYRRRGYDYGLIRIEAAG